MVLARCTHDASMCKQDASKPTKPRRAAVRAPRSRSPTRQSPKSPVFLARGGPSPVRRGSPAGKLGPGLSGTASGCGGHWAALGGLRAALFPRAPVFWPVEPGLRFAAVRHPESRDRASAGPPVAVAGTSWVPHRPRLMGRRARRRAGRRLRRPLPLTPPLLSRPRHGVARPRPAAARLVAVSVPVRRQSAGVDALIGPHLAQSGRGDRSRSRWAVRGG